MVGFQLRGTELKHQIPEYGRLYLTVPLPRTWTTLCAETRRAGLQIDEPFSGVFAVSVTPTQLQELVHVWSAALSSAELEHTRCFLVDSYEEPSSADLMNAQPLTCLIDWINGQWLRDVIESGRLLTHFQPVVRCAKPDVVYAYECLLRGRIPDGKLITPDRLYSAARRTGWLDCLDCAARLTAIESASRRRLDSCVFINFNPRSIDDPLRSLESTIQAVLESTLSAENYVFEVVESDKVSDIDLLIRIVDHLRTAGCRLALDDVGAGYNSLNLMAQLQPDFIKLDMGLIRDIDRDEYKACVTAKILELARELGVQTVVEGVETAREWQWAREHGADFAQGYLFARPAEDPPKCQFAAQNPTADDPRNETLVPVTGGTNPWEEVGD